MYYSGFNCLFSKVNEPVKVTKTSMQRGVEKNEFHEGKAGGQPASRARRVKLIRWRFRNRLAHVNSDEFVSTIRYSKLLTYLARVALFGDELGHHQKSRAEHMLHRIAPAGQLIIEFNC